MAIEFREILDDELEVARRILDAAYGASPARAERLRRYRSLDPTTWLLDLDDGEPVPRRRDRIYGQAIMAAG
jgi:hypothetical protein